MSLLMTAMSETLRPLSLGEILDRTAQLYRRNFLLFAGVAAAPTGVLVAVATAIGATIALFGATTKAAVPPNALAVVLILAIVLVAMPILIAATVVSQAGLTRAAVAAHMGQKFKIRAAIKSVWPRFWRYLWLLILQAILAALIPAAVVVAIFAALAYLASLAGGGTAASAALGVLAFVAVLAAVVYMVWRAIGYSLALAVCVVEDMPAWNSIKRSVTLSKGTRGRIFLMLLLVWALTMVLSMMAYVPIVMVIAVVTAIGNGAEYATATAIAAEILNFLLNFALQTLIAPVYITALVLFYYDQRIRTEGYDIEWMMEQAGLTGPGTLAGAGLGGATAEPAVNPAANLDTVKEI